MCVEIPRAPIRSISGHVYVLKKLVLATINVAYHHFFGPWSGDGELALCFHVVFAESRQRRDQCDTVQVNVVSVGRRAHSTRFCN